jgi:hypothetical protein
MTMGTWWALVGMSIAAIGLYGSKGPFWAMSPMFLTGMAAAGAIAWINSIGNLGGFFGSWYVGFMKDLTDSYAGGLYGLALFGVVAAFISVFFLQISDAARLGPHRGGADTGAIGASALTRSSATDMAQYLVPTERLTTAYAHHAAAGQARPRFLRPTCLAANVFLAAKCGK